MEIIKLEQIPILTSKIDEVSEQVDARIKALDLDKQVATPQTVKALKKTRAELNNEFKTFEEQRKSIKNVIYEPFTKFEVKYKDKIATKYKEADALLKDLIFSVEDKIKSEKAEKLKAYFNELCEAKEIDFLTFEQLNLNVTLSASEKSLKEQVNEFVKTIEKDLDLIKCVPESEDFKTDVLVEYKRSFDVNQALKIVQERKKQKELELQRIAEQKAKAEEVKEETLKVEEQPKQEILHAPVVEKQPKVLQATFTVKGTMEQLRTLKQFLINNNIEIL